MFVDKKESTYITKSTKDIMKFGDFLDKYRTKTYDTINLTQKRTQDIENSAITANSAITGAPNQYAHQPVPVQQEQPAPVQPVAPAVVQNIANTVNQFMPALEQITGLTRREIFLHLLKTGLKGGSFESMISGLLGQATTPPADAKFVRYVKTLAIWVPVALLLTGLSIVSVFVFAKFLLSMV